MNKELARRVEAAAIEMACGGTLSPRLAWAELDEHSRNLALTAVQSHLAAAFPELFTDPPQAGDPLMQGDSTSTGDGE